MQLRAMAVALALLGAAAAGPSPAVATNPGFDPFDRIPAAGSDPSGAEFIGTLDVREFEARGDELVAVGTLSGQLARTVGGIVEPVGTLDEARVEVPVGAVSASCERLVVAFGPLPLDPLGPVVQVNPIRVDDADPTANGGSAEPRLCAIAARLQGATPAVLADQLDGVAASFN